MNVKRQIDRMAVTQFNLVNFLIRFGFALVLVMATFNPSGVSFYHWMIKSWPEFHALILFSGVVLLIGWTIYIRATVRSLNVFGLVLATAFFGSLLWILVEWQIVSMTNSSVMGYIVLFIIAAVLAVGISWSHIRRRLTGQHDVDEIEE